MADNKPYKIEVGAPEYDVNTSYFNVVMNNLLVIDSALAGADGYSNINVPLLIDSLIAKILSKEEKKRIKEFKRDTIKSYKEGKKTKEDLDIAILEANMEALGECIEYFNKYLTFETKLGIMVA